MAGRAGLGAFAKAQGGGNKVFKSLMKKGLRLQRKTQAAAEEKLGDAAGQVAAKAGEVGHKANAQWDKLETHFEERTARALAKLGAPSAKTLTDLGARLDALTTAVAGLQAADAPAAKPQVIHGKDLATKAASAAAAAAAAAPAPTPTPTPTPTPAPAPAAAAPAEAAPVVAVKRRKAKAAAPKPVKAARKRFTAKTFGG